MLVHIAMILGLGSKINCKFIKQIFITLPEKNGPDEIKPVPGSSGKKEMMKMPSSSSKDVIFLTPFIV
jgi:hypothetical protein